MRKQELYDAWKENARRVGISESFTDDVMGQVYRYEQEKRKAPSDMRWLIKLVSAHPLAQAALVAVGAMTGFIRIVFIILVILHKGDING